VLSLRILFLIYLFSTFKTKFGLLSSEMSNLPNMVNYIQMKLEIQNDDIISDHHFIIQIIK
jgi:hypothetical protein